MNKILWACTAILLVVLCSCLVVVALKAHASEVNVRASIPFFQFEVSTRGGAR